MAETRVQRRLAAILAADVVGYSRLMGADEAGTLAALKSRRTTVLNPLVAKHQGRIFKTTGDGVLVEFASAVNAVECAAALQQAMAAANAELPEDRRILVRIGINLGDVLVEGGDLYGEGVNVAARLEGLAEPGGICVADSVHSHVRGKVAARFEDMGEQALKNIAAPVRVYGVRPGEAPPATPPAVALPDKPSIAVLPFTNMSGDPEQQYFSDGITEDIITELARFRQLDVVARNSSFQYRDQAVDVKRVGRELGARYVVEGSVRKAGPRVRITAQLIDADTGNHLWAERYDRELQDIFAIQDEVVTTVVARLAGAVQSADFEAARRKRTENLGAYDCYLRGMEIFYRTAGGDTERACELFERAITLDPDFALAYAHLAIALIFDYWASAHRSPAESATMLDRALEAASTAVALDDSDATCHRALAHVQIGRRAFDLAEHHLNMASELNPNDSELLSYRAWFEVCAGRPDSALRWLDRGQRLSSRQQFWQWELRGMALYHLQRYADAIAAFERMPTGPAWCERYRAACYAQLGRLEEARAKAAEAMRRDPGFTLRRYAEVEPYQSRASLEHMIEGMRKAGLPE